MLINRVITKLILDKLAGEPRVIVLYGPRQSGKTVILHEITDRERKNGKETLFLKGDDAFLSVSTVVVIRQPSQCAKEP